MTWVVMTQVCAHVKIHQEALRVCSQGEGRKEGRREEGHLPGHSHTEEKRGPPKVPSEKRLIPNSGKLQPLQTRKPKANPTAAVSYFVVRRVQHKYSAAPGGRSGGRIRQCRCLAAGKPTSQGQRRRHHPQNPTSNVKPHISDEGSVTLF